MDGCYPPFDIYAFLMSYKRKGGRRGSAAFPVPARAPPAGVWFISPIALYPEHQRRLAVLNLWQSLIALSMNTTYPLDEYTIEYDRPRRFKRFDNRFAVHYNRNWAVEEYRQRIAYLFQLKNLEASINPDGSSFTFVEFYSNYPHPTYFTINFRETFRDLVYDDVETTSLDDDDEI